MAKSKIQMAVTSLLENDGWTPRPSDIQWTQNMLGMVKDGGSWVVPMTQSIYRVNHTAHTLELTEGNATDLHDKVVKVCSLLNPPYAVTIAPERRQNLQTN